MNGGSFIAKIRSHTLPFTNQIGELFKFFRLCESYMADESCQINYQVNDVHGVSAGSIFPANQNPDRPVSFGNVLRI